MNAVCELCGRFPARRVAQGVRCVEHMGFREPEPRRLGDDQPRQPAVEISVEDPAIPDKVRKAVAVADAHGWRRSLTRFESAEGRHFLALRARRHDNRQQVAMIWEWSPPHWTPATKTREARWVDKAEWLNREAWTAPWSPSTHTAAMGVLSS